jgi:hypothetical protein
MKGESKESSKQQCEQRAYPKGGKVYEKDMKAMSLALTPLKLPERRERDGAKL